MERYLIIFGMLFGASFGVNACELTEDYKALRLEVYQGARKAYESCTDSVSKFYYWKSVADCKANGLENSVKGGCIHIAGYKMGADLEEKHKHCEILKPDVDEIKAQFDEVVKERDIRMCVESVD